MILLLFNVFSSGLPSRKLCIDILPSSRPIAIINCDVPGFHLMDVIPTRPLPLPALLVAANGRKTCVTYRPRTSQIRTVPSTDPVAKNISES